jgi:hypothetical protein
MYVYQGSGDQGVARSSGPEDSFVPLGRDLGQDIGLPTAKDAALIASRLFCYQ